VEWVPFREGFRRPAAKRWSDVPRTRSACPPDVRREAIELLRQGPTPGELSKSLGVSPQRPRDWRRQDQLDHGKRDDGATSDEREELARLRRENLRPRQERGLLKRAATFENTFRFALLRWECRRSAESQSAIRSSIFVGSSSLAVTCCRQRRLTGEHSRCAAVRGPP